MQVMEKGQDGKDNGYYWRMHLIVKPRFRPALLRKMKPSTELQSKHSASENLVPHSLILILTIPQTQHLIQSISDSHNLVSALMERRQLFFPNEAFWIQAAASIFCLIFFPGSFELQKSSHRKVACLCPIAYFKAARCHSAIPSASTKPSKSLHLQRTTHLLVLLQASITDKPVPGQCTGQHTAWQDTDISGSTKHTNKTIQH